ncbi:CLUMA_CG004875, isoform A [Clunio marinus]|uniref:CLUMA_CG004875, isoform A n=1 Tax=Clunio marinus TaxID=568069 RepID=A0A1J1HSZ9_9DIPT|nr:CLUMA_CG004875, isoform A [Clunio marinus]
MHNEGFRVLLPATHTNVLSRDLYKWKKKERNLLKKIAKGKKKTWKTRVQQTVSGSSNIDEHKFPKKL